MMLNIEIKETEKEKEERIKKIHEMFANEERICEKYEKAEPRSYEKKINKPNKKFDYKKHHDSVINAMTCNGTTY